MGQRGETTPGAVRAVLWLVGLAGGLALAGAVACSSAGELPNIDAGGTAADASVDLPAAEVEDDPGDPGDDPGDDPRDNGI